MDETIGFIGRICLFLLLVCWIVGMPFIVGCGRLAVMTEEECQQDIARMSVTKAGAELAYQTAYAKCLNGNMSLDKLESAEKVYIVWELARFGKITSLELSCEEILPEDLLAITPRTVDELKNEVDLGTL